MEYTTVKKNELVFCYWHGQSPGYVKWEKQLQNNMCRMTTLALGGKKTYVYIYKFAGTSLEWYTLNCLWWLPLGREWDFADEGWWKGLSCFTLYAFVSLLFEFLIMNIYI